MKTKDGYLIPERIVKYLTGWLLEDTYHTLTLLYNQKKLEDLTLSQVCNLVSVASGVDQMRLESLKNK